MAVLYGVWLSIVPAQDLQQAARMAVFDCSTLKMMVLSISAVLLHKKVIERDGGLYT